MADYVERIAHSVVIAASAETLYDLIADVRRMGEWSPACSGADWDAGAGPLAAAGAWFTGHNVVDGRAYDRHCEITAAERPAAVAWMQAGRAEGIAEWRYEFAAVDGGTEVTESWTLLRPYPPGRVDAALAERMRVGFDAGIRSTLSRLKRAVEAS